MDLNRFDNYAVNILGPKNYENCELELKNIGRKYKDKIKLVHHNDIRNEKWNQIYKTNKEFTPPLKWKLDNGTWIH